MKPDGEFAVTPKRYRATSKSAISFKLDTAEEHEVVCTPDIFGCLGDDLDDNPDDPDYPPPVEEPVVVPEPPAVPLNGTDESNTVKKPRISVRPPESLMQSPDQPMFSTIAQNRMLLCPMPGPSIVMNEPPLPMPGNIINSGGGIIRPINTKLLMPKPNTNYNSKVRYNLLPMQHMSNVHPPPLSPLLLNASIGNINAPNQVALNNANNVNQINQIKNLPTQNNRTNSKFIQVNKTAGKTYINRSKTITQPVIPINTDTSSRNKPNDQTLSALLQKKLKDNPNINSIQLRKLPEWFHTNTQSCLVIAYNFVSQLLDLQTKAQKVQNCTYDAVKNMHVQLSFFISALIGKLKSNQSELNTQLSEWTDTLCKTLEEQTSEPISQPQPVVTIIDTPRKLSAAELGMQVREDYKNAFKEFEKDKKLHMDPIVKVSKFKFHKSTNVFKVKPKVRQIIRTPNIDPNVIQTIDSDSDDDDCQIISDQPVTIDLVGNDETSGNKNNDTKSQKEKNSNKGDNTEEGVKAIESDKNCSTEIAGDGDGMVQDVATDSSQNNKAKEHVPEVLTEVNDISAPKNTEEDIDSIRIHHDKVDPIETQNEQIDSTVAQNDQLDPAVTQNDQLNSAATLKDQLDSAVTQNDKLDSAVTQNDQLDLAVTQNEELDLAVTQNEELDSSENQNKPIDDTEIQHKQIDDTKMLNKPIVANEFQDKPIEATKIQDKLIDNTENTDDTENLNKTSDDTESLNKTTDDTAISTKPIDAIEIQNKPVDAIETINTVPNNDLEETVVQTKDSLTGQDATNETKANAPTSEDLINNPDAFHNEMELPEEENQNIKQKDANTIPKNIDIANKKITNVSDNIESKTIVNEIESQKQGIPIIMPNTHLGTSMEVDDMISNRVLGLHDSNVITESLLSNRPTTLETDTIIGNKHSNIADATEQALRKLECVIGLEEMNANQNIEDNDEVTSNIEKMTDGESGMNSFLNHSEQNISNAE